MMKGVTSNGIFSDSATVPTGLDLSILNWSVHGSTLMRPPSGSAAMTLAAGFASASGDGAENTAATMVQLVESLSPKCGLIRLGTSLDRDLRAWRNSCAIPDCSLYGELLNSSVPLSFAPCSSSGVRAKSKWLNVSFSLNRTRLKNPTCDPIQRPRTPYPS